MKTNRCLLIGCYVLAGVVLPHVLYAAQDIGQEIKQRMFDDVWESGDNLPNLGESPLQVAQSSGDETKMEKPMSEECLKFAQDIDADVGEIMRAGCEPTTAQMARLMDNPLGSVAMWINQLDIYRMTNESVTDVEANKSNYMSLFQFPKKLGDNWNLINRVVLNISSMPLDQGQITAANRPAAEYSDITGVAQPPADGPVLPINQFRGRTTGFGDTYYVGLFSPADPIVYKDTPQGKGIGVWGLGFDLGIPTASDDILGSGKWMGGPSALYVYMGPKWKIGGLIQHYWDFAGDSARAPVNLTNIQYFVYYTLDPVTSIGAGPNIIGNWEQGKDDRWTVPIGLGINRTVQFGKVPVRFAAEVHYSVVQPDNVPSNEWNFRFQITPAAPSALFKWMQ